MSKYYCNRCGYSTNQITHFKNHLKRKKICKPILEDISIEQICFIYNFDITKFSPQISTNSPQKSTFSPQKFTFSTQISKTIEKQDYICKYCNKHLSRIDSLNRHMTKCKKKTEELCLLETELKEVKEELSKTKQIITTNNNINKTTNNNSHNTINNTININNFGEENIKHIDYSYYSNILKGIYGAVPKLVEKIHFDKEHPENQNIKLTNKKEPYIKIRKNNKWKLADRKTEVLDLIDSKCFLLSEKYKKLLKKEHNLSDSQQDTVDSFIEQYNEDNTALIDNLINKTELMLLNNSK
jgi:hypothetical protein